MTSTDPSLAHRLPRTVVPSRYELRLEPDLDEATFAGRVAIDVEVAEATDEVLLNALELEVDEAILERGADVVPLTAEVDSPGERLRLRSAEPVPPGPARVVISFRGVLNDKLRGFYRSTFSDEDAHDQVLATTQFEATDARRAFPCWDEPDLKASFEVTLVVPDGLLAISNTRETGRDATGDGRVEVRFAETIPMSTYLVAFVVGPLEATEAVDVDGTPLRVVHRPGRGHLTPYALEVGAFALRYLADYYALPYPGDKLDLVAIPDFAFGAMENLGCVTFREVLLLVDPEAASQPELQNVVDVIAHELAHMWFGDLVTMRWWNGIWLNEAFATFMEMKATDAFRPEWQRWVSFGQSRSAALDVDALLSTRPVEYPVASPEEAEGMFDVLTYEKGAAVVRMLEQYLGEDQFRDGIRTYLDAHAYANTETTELWDALESSSGEPVRRIMDGWIFQGGYPEVVAERSARDQLELTQHRFTYLGDAGKTTWSTPVLVRTASDGASRLERLLLEDRATIEVDDTADAVLLNATGSGFYRIRYDAGLLGALLERAQRDLSPLERFCLVDDTWASVLAGHTPAASFLDLARRFGEESDLTVWERLLGGLGRLDRLVEGAPRERLREDVRTLLGPAVERIGLHPGPDDDDRTRQLRARLLEGLGVLGDDEAFQQGARVQHEAYLADRTTVDPALAAAAVTVLAHVGDPQDHEAFLERFEHAADPQEEQRYLYALADFGDPDLFRRTLALSLSERVRTQNAPYLLRRALTHRDRGPDAWAFVVERWDEIGERFPQNSIPRMLEGVRSLDRPEAADDVQVFLAEHPVPQGQRQVDQHLERLRVNLALRTREADALTAALS